MSIFPRTKPLGDPSALRQPSPGAGWGRQQGCRGLGAIWLLDKLGIAPRQHPRHTFPLSFAFPSWFYGSHPLLLWGSARAPWKREQLLVHPTACGFHKTNFLGEGDKPCIKSEHHDAHCPIPHH